jgi:hypothetical protein
MKLLIAIPSKGRANTIFKHTMRWVTRTGFDVKVFVEPQELEAYRESAKDGNYQHYLDVKDDQFIDIGANDKGLGYAKGFIKKYAIEHGYNLVFKLDDDVNRFNSRGKNKPDEEMIILFSTMVGACRKAFGRYPDVAAIGFPYRNELFEPKLWSAINARLQSCYIIKPEYILDEFNTFEDFAQYLNIRAQNKVTLRYGLLGIDAAEVGANKGGLQLFNREDQMNEELPKLRKIYPALEFKPVKGKNWSIEPVLSGEFFGVKKL